MPRKPIPLGYNSNPEIRKGGNFVLSQAVQHEYSHWFAQTRLKQLDGLAKRLRSRTRAHINSIKEEVVQEFVKRREKGKSTFRGSFGAMDLFLERVDNFMISSLKVSPEAKKAAMGIQETERQLTRFFVGSTLRNQFPKKEFVDLAKSVLSHYAGLSDRRKQELAKKQHFSFERISANVEKLARSGAKNYIPDIELVVSLKDVNTSRLWDALGDDAAYVYKHAYAAAKTSIFDWLL